MDPITFMMILAGVGLTRKAIASHRHNSNSIATRKPDENLDIVGEGRYDENNFLSGHTVHHGINIKGEPWAIATCVEALDQIEAHSERGIPWIKQSVRTIELVDMDSRYDDGRWGYCRPRQQMFGIKTIYIRQELGVSDMAQTIVHEMGHMRTWSCREEPAEEIENMYLNGELKDRPGI